MKLLAHWLMIFVAVGAVIFAISKSLWSLKFWFGVVVGGAIASYKWNNDVYATLRGAPPKTIREALFLNRIKHGRVLRQWKQKPLGKVTTKKYMKLEAIENEYLKRYGEEPTAETIAEVWGQQHVTEEQIEKFRREFKQKLNRWPTDDEIFKKFNDQISLETIYDYKRARRTGQLEKSKRYHQLN